jgi:cell division septation protein DedD
MPRGPSRYHSLRSARRGLTRMAPVVRFGIASAGISVFLDQARPLLTDAQFTWGERRVMGIIALVTVLGFGLAAWVAGHLLRTAAELIDVVVDGVEANERTAELMERHMIPALNRLALALERAPANPPQGAIDALRRRLDAARAAGDGDAAIDARDALTEHLRGQALADLDRDVVRWLYGLVQERARDGLTSEVVALAERTADSFGDTAEAAALRSALPRLRRSAGLCPRCGRPHRGAADACPRCVAAASPSSESEVRS